MDERLEARKKEVKPLRVVRVELEGEYWVKMLQEVMDLYGIRAAPDLFRVLLKEKYEELKSRQFKG